MIKVSNRSKRPTESAKSRLNGHVYEHVVHEHLVRARSRKLAETIDEKKKQAKGNEEVTIQINASSQMVGCWLRWLYGQPMFTWDDGIHDEVLENHVEMYDLACEADDYGCMNACLDAIREFLCQPKPSRLENPIFALKSMLEPKLTLDGDVDQTNNKPTDMIVDVLVYGPCADSGQTAEWLNFLKNDMYPIEEQAWFYQKLCIVSAKKLAQASRDHLVTGTTPDYMALHKYHFCEKGEKFCCDRKAPREMSPKTGKRKVRVAEEDG